MEGMTSTYDLSKVREQKADQQELGLEGVLCVSFINAIAPENDEISAS